MNYYNKLQVEAIKRGTVVDHIPAKVGMKLLSIFKLNVTNEKITIGLNLPSNKNGIKDLIKLENVFLNTEQASQLAIYAQYATINLIDNYHVVNKQKLQLPKYIYGSLICPNSNCISRTELITSSFCIKFRKKKLHLQCKYCEKEFEHHALIKKFK